MVEKLQAPTVLVVDDQPANLRVIQVNLEREGYRVLTALDGVEGLEQARRHHPDLILLDVIMPRKDGIEMLRELKEDQTTAGIPVVMLSVDSRNSTIFRGHRGGAHSYLPKPFHPNELLEIVRRALAESRAG